MSDWETERAAVLALVAAAQGAPDPQEWLAGSLAGEVQRLVAARGAAGLLTWLRADEAVSFVVYEAPRGVCAKPQELVHALLDALVRELVEDAPLDQRLAP